jgi:hypothetical protein
VSWKVLGPWRPLDLLVVALPVAVVAKALDLGAAAMFVLGALAVIPSPVWSVGPRRCWQRPSAGARAPC